MRKMTLLEQSAQVFYLRCWYDLRATLFAYKQKKTDEGTPVPPFIQRQLASMNTTMAKAQAAWKKKFDDESMCDKIKRVVTNSPRKRKYDSDSSSSPEGNSRRRIDAMPF